MIKILDEYLDVGTLSSPRPKPQLNEVQSFITSNRQSAECLHPCPARSSTVGWHPIRMEWYLSFLHLWFADSLGCPAIEDTHQYQYGFAIWKGGTLSTRENDPVNVPLSLDIHRTCNPGLGPLVSGDTENPQLQRERLSNLFCLKIPLKWIATLFYQPWKMGSDFREENKCAP